MRHTSSWHRCCFANDWAMQTTEMNRRVKAHHCGPTTRKSILDRGEGAMSLMRKNHRLVCAAMLFLVSIGGAPRLPRQPAAQTCDAIQVLRMCDPYVPGTIIAIPGKQPITVISTWPRGPAEKAGMCAGDRILAVNGVLASDNTRDRMLKEIASDSPSPVRLKIARGTEIREIGVDRVRESTLANLSQQKYARVEGLFVPIMSVPLDETADEIEQIQRFQERIDKRYGFKAIESVSVPAGTPRDQVEKVLARIIREE
jgi:hypothetical protein